MKKIPLIHGKFRAKNNPMKFHFAVFMGHEMIFMGFSREIHGIFIKLLQFIVNPRIKCPGQMKKQFFLSIIYVLFNGFVFRVRQLRLSFISHRLKLRKLH